MGTAAYMSPEQAQGKPLDERSEVFSFGAVLYEMLSGRRAFAGASMLDILNAVVRTEPAQVKAPDALTAILSRCLRKSPAERFQSVAEVRAALAAIGSARDEQKQPSIAVLPFANLSADPEQEYFSDGLAEEIINALVQVPGLKVIARTSAFAFKGQNADVRRIAETLGVAHVLEGSVRKSGNRIRVTAQLITAADGSHLWSQRYDRDLADVFAVQDEVATAITGALRVKLRHAPGAHVPSPEAHEALLKGRHHLFKLTPESMALSLGYLKKAVELDPNSAAAQAGLSSYYFGDVAGALVSPPNEDAESLARAAALRAVELDPLCQEAHAALCGIAAVLDHDWAEAERRFMLATSGESVSSEARRMVGFNYLLSAGRPLEAARQLEIAFKDDPLNTFIAMQLGACLHAAGDSQNGFKFCSASHRA